jgi:DNA repair ATPase RecN
MSDFDQERLVYQNSTQEKDEGMITETDNKIQEMDTLFDCIENELERIELELQTVYDCHVEYDSAVQDWLAWFAEAKNKLNACQMEEMNGQSIDRKDHVIQVVLNLNFMLSSSVSSKLLIIPPNIHAP